MDKSILIAEEQSLANTKEIMQALVLALSTPSPTHIKGIRGLAKYLQVSTTTAQKIKNSGAIPYRQIGKIIWFSIEEVRKAMAANCQTKKAE